MIRRPILVAALAALLATPVLSSVAAGQQVRVEESRWTPVRVLKWAMLGTAIGFGAYALVHSTRADDAYTELRQICDATPDRCRITGAGPYEDAAVEELFTQTRHEDRRAQVGIVGGQVTLFGSVGLFIYDLRHARGPENIPYPSAREMGGPGLAAGVRVPF